jgi:hypothetical protein
MGTQYEECDEDAEGEAYEEEDGSEASQYYEDTGAVQGVLFIDGPSPYKETSHRVEATESSDEEDEDSSSDSE